MRFFLDESSLAILPGADIDAQLDRLMELLALASEHGEDVACWSDVYSVILAPDFALYDFLFGEGAPVERLDFAIALDRMRRWDTEDAPEELDVTVDGATVFAPTLAHAANRAALTQEAVGCLSLLTAAARHGVKVVTAGTIQSNVFFIADPSDRRGFFRWVVERESVDHHRFPDIAQHAFPRLAWVEDVWQGLKTHKSCFFGPQLRPLLMRDLTVLDDYGVEAFRAHPGGQGVETELASHGVNASSENGKARSHQKSRGERTRIWREERIEFWWHSKITHNKGRIHFHFDPAFALDDRDGIIVVGIFAEHLYLPN